MHIAIASGKGGTGKTTVAVALARVMGSCVLVDCDVEAPNAHLFLNPDVQNTQDAYVMIPEVDDGKCTGCGECSRVCQFNALAVLGKSVLVFNELCHGCGGCVLACEPKAITEGGRLIGTMQWGKAGNLDFYDAKLRIGEPMSPPLIKALKRQAECLEAKNTILDCPPGTTCPMVEAVGGADYCILVTEPTPFGLHDLNMAYQAVQQMDIPAGVILNRAGMGDDCIQEYCKANGIPILLEIPHSREIAEGYAAGKDILSSMPSLEDGFKKVINTISEGLNNG
ncbi:ATP-binding protein [Desulfatibacillum aliphaticivorans]|uniref:ATP-binding protein n=1 Tax=Desulfatibacillum aliphaticivorans TaxID=218208 RepID=UPI0003FC88ED|nr:ATP-binding protein [Desulfatibacillum aliphaticivorans]